jgi:hypothetical protein
MSDEQRTVTPLINENARHAPIPRPFAYPSRYGLANAVTALVGDYGRIGAINVLVEMAEMLDREEDPLFDTLRRRRLLPERYANAG